MCARSLRIPVWEAPDSRKHRAGRRIQTRPLRHRPQCEMHPEDWLGCCIRNAGCARGLCVFPCGKLLIHENIVPEGGSKHARYVIARSAKCILKTGWVVVFVMQDRSEEHTS